MAQAVAEAVDPDDEVEPIDYEDAEDEVGCCHLIRTSRTGTVSSDPHLIVSSDPYLPYFHRAI
jgi:hypothetical protein